MQEQAIRPVTVLIGFLGAGKTTYLNALRVANPDKRYAIIENEIGQVNVDGQILHQDQDLLIELQDGCLCCTLNSDLYAALDQLNQRASDFDELVVECTGLALPATIIEPFTVHPVFKRIFPLKRTVCLVDAELIEDQLQERDEVLRQITAADVILINKTEYVHPDYVLSLKKNLAKLNPLASVFLERAKGVFPFDEIEKVRYIAQKSFFFLVNRATGQAESVPLISDTVGKVHKDITVKTYVFDQEFNFIHLYFFLSRLVASHQDKIYRMKGIAFKSEERRKIFVQSVGSRIDVDYGGVWEENETRQNTFVFIGKDIDGLRVDEYLNELLIISIDKVS
ncbi:MULTISPECIES: CobW family GTP-binding protein [Sphingobacterium]|uniref:G3E family GTPase n=2 Tax=Sphingobacterium TaxID=28453 RepID=A0A4R6WHY9_9SPHI|nr:MULTISPECIES: GTP-binding protein [Sphingobacterium]TDQ78136.1 G3E family GTPase [Sphingobacterium yanglingense]